MLVQQSESLLQAEIYPVDVAYIYMIQDNGNSELFLFILFAGEDGASVDGSVSSGDEVLGIDSSPAPSPLLANVQGINKVKYL